ncbi:MAG: ROK family transcriptional regulator [Bacillota bacterium]
MENYAKKIKHVKQVKNVKQVKKLNRMNVLSLIKEYEVISRKDLADITGLTPPAITNIIREFLELGLVTEEGVEESKGGRRAVKLKFNHESGYVLGLEVMMNEVKIAVTDLKNDPTYFETFSIDMSDPNAGVKALLNEIKQFMKSKDFLNKKIIAVGIAFPALVLAKEGIIKRAVNLGPLWDRFPLKNIMEQELNLPVFIENNSNASALAERWFGGGTNSRDLVYINLGEGISAGIIMDDRIVYGFQGHAGEIGHILVRHNGPLCNCGNRGCLESICGIPALTRKANAELPLLSNSDPLKELWEHNKKVTINDIMTCAQNEGSYAWEIIRQAGKDIGIALASLINLYNPEVIFIGGKLSAAKDVLLGPIIDEIRAHSFPEIATITKIKISALGKNSGTIGACALAIRELFKPSSGVILNEICGQEAF